MGVSGALTQELTRGVRQLCSPGVVPGDRRKFALPGHRLAQSHPAYRQRPQGAAPASVQYQRVGAGYDEFVPCLTPAPQ